MHKGQADYDAERDQVLARRVLRISNADVRDDIEAVLARIASAAGEWTPNASG